MTQMNNPNVGMRTMICQFYDKMIRSYGQGSLAIDKIFRSRIMNQKNPEQCRKHIIPTLESQSMNYESEAVQIRRILHASKTKKQELKNSQGCRSSINSSWVTNQENPEKCRKHMIPTLEAQNINYESEAVKIRRLLCRNYKVIRVIDHLINSSQTGLYTKKVQSNAGSI